MTTISWSDDLSVGVHILDADHRLLIDLIKQFNGAVDSGQDPDRISAILNAIYDYTDFHFIREETLMKACGYEDVKAHHGVHEKLTGRMKEICQQYAASEGADISDGIKTFLNEWLTRHIMGHDKNYAQSMAGKEQQIAEAHRPFMRQWSIAESAEASDSI
ncbi:MAG: bacteriohemerythrin [Rhodospirillales bacterium]